MDDAALVEPRLCADARCRPGLSLYTNDLVALRPKRRLNNGQPSLHAYLMHQAAPTAGEHVVHIGTGTGYYTAILAHLVGPSGRVTGIEYDPDLAADARANLAAYANVEIIQGDGTQVAFESADVIYVNAGCTRPATRWLDGLAAGGRLILPLTSDEGFKGGAPEQVARSGAVFRIRREEAVIPPGRDVRKNARRSLRPRRLAEGDAALSRRRDPR
ncbi:methyltransferase domain-containing protein [Bradyrhizobium sp. BRP56]|uniref:protein-L-isoaspartate O-methyltransferase family protein n=1 Tax=Bradyrhizobium sp. BRP56 TaxID=2793819 RepID=UPI001CD33CCE|nr:methyltransferase domain-containing protein [Bradyrhizobium sp. BRP56]